MKKQRTKSDVFIVDKRGETLGRISPTIIYLDHGSLDKGTIRDGRRVVKEGDRWVYKSDENFDYF